MTNLVIFQSTTKQKTFSIDIWSSYFPRWEISANSALDCRQKSQKNEIPWKWSTGLYHTLIMSRKILIGLEKISTVYSCSVNNINVDTDYGA